MGLLDRDVAGPARSRRTGRGAETARPCRAIIRLLDQADDLPAVARIGAGEVGDHRGPRAGPGEAAGRAAGLLAQRPPSRRRSASVRLNCNSTTPSRTQLLDAYRRRHVRPSGHGGSGRRSRAAQTPRSSNVQTIAIISRIFGERRLPSRSGRHQQHIDGYVTAARRQWKACATPAVLTEAEPSPPARTATPRRRTATARRTPCRRRISIAAPLRLGRRVGLVNATDGLSHALALQVERRGRHHQHQGPAVRRRRRPAGVRGAGGATTVNISSIAGRARSSARAAWSTAAPSSPSTPSGRPAPRGRPDIRTTVISPGGVNTEPKHGSSHADPLKALTPSTRSPSAPTPSPAPSPAGDRAARAGRPAQAAIELDVDEVGPPCASNTGRTATAPCNPAGP